MRTRLTRLVLAALLTIAVAAAPPWASPGSGGGSGQGHQLSGGGRPGDVRAGRVGIWPVRVGRVRFRAVRVKPRREPRREKREVREDRIRRRPRPGRPFRPPRSAVDQAIGALLAPDPADRPSTAAQVLALLAEALPADAGEEDRLWPDWATGHLAGWPASAMERPPPVPRPA